MVWDWHYTATKVVTEVPVPYPDSSMKIARNIQSLFIAGCVGLIPKVVFASVADTVGSGLSTAASGGGYSNGKKLLPDIVGNLINSAFDIFGILLLVYILYGGYKYMTAQGDSKNVDTAKDTIKNAIIGTVILISANFIATYVVDALSKATTGA